MTEGIWRDGDLFVVDLVRHTFPSRCVKTNQEVGELRSLLTLSVKGVPWQDFFEAKGLIVDSSQMPVSTWETRRFNNTNVPLQIPLVADFRGLSRSKRGLRLAIGGIVGAVLSLVALLVAAIVDSVLLPLTAIALLVGLVVAVVGFVMLSNRNATILEIKKLSDGKIWVEGADLLWLEALPSFVESPSLLQRSLENARMTSRSLAFAASVVVLLALFVTGAGVAAHLDAGLPSFLKLAAYFGPLITILAIPAFVLSRRQKETADEYQARLSRLE